MTLLETAGDYGMPLVASPPYGLVGNWPESERSPEPTDTNSYSVKLFGVPAGVGTAGELSGNKIFSFSSEHVIRIMLLAQLGTLRRTPESERWPGADWPAALAFEDAAEFIRVLPLALIPLPGIAFADDGEINFLWKDGGVHVDLGFYGTNTFSYFAQARDGRKFHGEAIPPSSGLPPEVVALFAA